MTVKPLLKWVGGKSQIVDKIICEFPKEIDNYHELFLGGGSVLLALLSARESGKIKVNNVYAYDLCEPLINFYKNVQNAPDKLYAEVTKITEIFYEIPPEPDSAPASEVPPPLNRNPVDITESKQCRESYYYWIRKQYNIITKTNPSCVEASAMLVFLNKTCFRGLYRIGPNGFNVPYGNYKKPEILNRDMLYEVHRLIQSVTFTCSDFTAFDTSKLTPADLIYLDPPYVPKTTTSFVSYTENKFKMSEHDKLFELLDPRATSKILMNNSDVEYVRKKCESNPALTVKAIVCKRSINSKNPQSTADEVIITNYKL